MNGKTARTIHYSMTGRGIEIAVTCYAKRVIGAPSVAVFVAALTTYMEKVRSNWAYVGGSGNTITVTLRLEGSRKA